MHNQHPDAIIQNLLAKSVLKLLFKGKVPIMKYFKRPPVFKNINPFHATDLFLCPLEISVYSDFLMFSGCLE